MRSSEWVAFSYFAYLGLVAWLRPLPARARCIITGVSAALLAAIPGVAAWSPPIARDWAPLVYIGFGYYLTGWLFVAPSRALEAWLLGWDRRLFGDPTRRFAHWPRWLVAYLDIVYMLCFLMLPGGFVALLIGGHGSEANHYWTMVAAADLGAFAPLSVFQTRPPWQVEPKPELSASSVHHLASLMVRNATIGANTFPSGHVAVSIAVALGVIGAMPTTGAVLLGLAATIAVACVVGRYHYAVDALAGAAWGLLVSLIVGVSSR